MTGTGRVAEAEFLDTYAMSVIKIQPIAKKIRRICRMKSIRPCPEKIVASLDYVKKVHEKGNPILVFAGSVEMSIFYSNLLFAGRNSHNLLNANNAPREAPDH